MKPKIRNIYDMPTGTLEYWQKIIEDELKRRSSQG